MILRVNRIQRFCLHDGPGIRTTVFLQGCPLRCWWCQNQETWTPESDEMRVMQIPELVRELERDADYWTESGGGVTVSGGEPLFQAEGVAALVEALESRGHGTAVDTSGAGEPDAVREISEHAGLWLWDIKTVTPALWREGTGGEPASLTQVLDNLAWVLRCTGTPLTVRVPLIARFNASPEELSRVAAWLGRQPRRPQVEVLPGHTYGATKRRAEGRSEGEDTCTEGIVPSPEQVERAREILGALRPGPPGTGGV